MTTARGVEAWSKREGRCYLDDDNDDDVVLTMLVGYIVLLNGRSVEDAGRVQVNESE
jgi:hypothetical protein